MKDTVGILLLKVKEPALLFLLNIQSCRWGQDKHDGCYEVSFSISLMISYLQSFLSAGRKLAEEFASPIYVTSRKTKHGYMNGTERRWERWEWMAGESQQVVSGVCSQHTVWQSGSRLNQITILFGQENSQTRETTWIITWHFVQFWFGYGVCNVAVMNYPSWGPRRLTSSLAGILWSW